MKTVHLGQVRVLFYNFFAHKPAKAPAHHTYLKAVCKARVYKIGFAKGYNLRFILKAPKGRREYNTVIIYLKAQAGIILLTAQALACVALPFKRQELFPLHHIRLQILDCRCKLQSYPLILLFCPVL
jgi:hypothetical protein